MQENFSAFFEAALEHEGKVFEDVPGDRGGPTKWGITIGRLAQCNGVKLPAKGTAAYAALRQELKDLSPERIEEIYRADYWDAVRGDELPSGLDYACSDFGLNSGPSRAVKYLQRLLDQPQTGKLQDEALEEIGRHPLDELISTYCDARARFLNGIVENNPSQAKFKKGWLSRVGDVRRTATKMAAAIPAPETVRVAMPKADDADTPTPNPSPSAGGVTQAGMLSERNFAKLNGLADQSSRVATHLRNFKAAIWKRTAVVGGGGATLVSSVDTSKGMGAAISSWASAHPFLFAFGLLLAVLALYEAANWLYAKAIEKGLISAHKDGRYAPRGGKQEA